MSQDVLDNPAYKLVTDPAELPELVNKWQCSEFLAIDTEFIRVNTFFAEPGLIQIADDQNVYLIDPVQIKDLSILIPVLENPRITKIMHSMNEDVGLLFHSLNAKITRVFDTQIAAAFLGIGVSLGYQNLVSEVLDIKLDKGETRSDWLQRPLTQSQLHYAALDVIFLLKLYHNLSVRLEETDFEEALFEETGFLIDQVVTSWNEPDLAYLKLRGAWDLPDASQRLLQALVIWRDDTAFQENIPKPWVFSDAVLIEAARMHPQSALDVKRIKGAKGKSLRQYAEPLVKIISEFSCDLSMPFKAIDGPVKSNELVKYRKLKTIVAQVSEQTEIPVQLLGSRKMLENLVIHCYRQGNSEFTSEFQGWRDRLMGEKFRNVLFSSND